MSETSDIARLGLSAAPPALRTSGVATEASRAALHRAAKAFEGMVLNQMLQPMFEGLGAEEPFGGGMAEDFWRSFQVEEYGKSIAGAGGIGLADVIYRQLLEAQESKGGER
jgi:Rod binding domain-containing protein